VFLGAEDPGTLGVEPEAESLRLGGDGVHSGPNLRDRGQIQLQIDPDPPPFRNLDQIRDELKVAQPMNLEVPHPSPSTIKHILPVESGFRGVHRVKILVEKYDGRPNQGIPGAFLGEDA
jgi:hypothetical protein